MRGVKVHFRTMRWPAFSLCPIFLILALSVWSLQTPASGPRFSRAQFDRVRIGMTLSEVEALMGCPHGHYCDFQDTADVAYHPVEVVDPTGRLKPWNAFMSFDDGLVSITLHLGDDATVQAKIWAVRESRLKSMIRESLEHYAHWLGLE